MNEMNAEKDAVCSVNDDIECTLVRLLTVS